MGEALNYLSVITLIIIIIKVIYDGLRICFPLHLQPNPSNWPFPSLSQRRPPAIEHAINIGIFGFHSIKNNIYIQVITQVLVNRLVLIVFVSLVYSFLESKPLLLWQHFDDIWFKWDTRHFLNIAENGYPTEGEEKFILVYYPLYPFLVRAANTLVNNYFASGILVSWLSLIIACIALYKLSLLEFKNEAIGKSSVKYLLLFPLSLFASMAYTESTFLMFSVLSFYFIRKRCFLWAGLFGAAAALTRNQGILLIAPLIYEMVRVWIVSTRAGWHYRWIHLGKFILAPLLIFSGFFAYLLLNYQVSGDWFRFIEYQKINWHQEIMFFADNIENIYARIGDGSSKISLGTWLPALVIFIFCLVLITFMTQALPTAYVIYSALFLVISYSPSWLISGARYMFVLFPIYMVLAKILHTRQLLSHYLDTTLILFSALICIAFLQFNVY